MRYDYDEIARLPAKLSLEDFRVICHISKRTARYYLQHGIVKCTQTGKKTRCYTIAKKDLVEALRQYEATPDFFSLPNGRRKIQARQSLSKDDLQNLVTRAYYEKKLENFIELLTTEQVSGVTGYSQKAVCHWCSRGRLPHIHMHPRNWIPRIILLDFLLSQDYNAIAQKSQTHLADIDAIFRQIHGEKQEINK